MDLRSVGGLPRGLPLDIRLFLFRVSLEQAAIGAAKHGQTEAQRRLAWKWRSVLATPPEDC